MNKNGFFSSFQQNLSNDPVYLTLNPNSFYYYLKKYYGHFKSTELSLIELLKKLPKNPKPHILSKDIAKELKTEPVIVVMIIYQLEKCSVLKSSQNINGDYWIYEIVKDKLDDCL